ncbi:hypothetical protein HDV02_006472 [Globomyces sp. JEL0801]|nr:hypothetical protein HDV02_006472 [Globomyces sp. JEL0801]
MPDIKDVSDSEVPDLEEVVAEDIPEMEGLAGKTISRSELKARKAMLKLGLKAVPGVERVVIKRSNGSMFVIGEPDVYKTLNGEMHIVFGNAEMEDFNAKYGMVQKVLGAAQAAQAEANLKKKDEESTEAVAEDDAVVDEEGVEANDIEMVMTQANVSRAKAVTALKVF